MVRNCNLLSEYSSFDDRVMIDDCLISHDWLLKLPSNEGSNHQKLKGKMKSSLESID